MKIGTSLQLTINDPQKDRLLNLRCTIIGVDKDYIFIDYPINIETSKTEYITDKTSLHVVYIGNDQVPHHFYTKVIKKVKLTIPALAILFPQEEKIKRIQRREYVRIRTAVDIALTRFDNKATSFTTVTSDISGGGVSIVLPENILIEKGAKVILWIVLPMQSKQIEYVKVQGEVIRGKKGIHNIKTISIRFISITNVDRQKIMRFCFEKQREARSKGLKI